MALRLEDLQPTPNSRKKAKRLGRGPGSGLGKTSGRGHKGQKARSGGGVRPGFEGGQTPLYMRSPKRGFKNVNRKEYTVFNLKQLDLLFVEGEEVSPETLKEKGAMKKMLDGVKILAYGTLSHGLIVSAHAFSAKAKEKIEAAGGKAQVIQTQTEEH